MKANVITIKFVICSVKKLIVKPFTTVTLLGPRSTRQKENPLWRKFYYDSTFQSNIQLCVII